MKTPVDNYLAKKINEHFMIGLPGKLGTIKLPGIEPVTIELKTSDNKIERTTTDRAIAHAAVDKFFDWHESEFAAMNGRPTE